MSAADVFAADRLPPQSKDAEKGVIGGVLRDNQVINDILTIIRPDNFYFDAHQKIFQAVIDVYNDGKPVDLVILFEILKSRKQLEDVGGAAYLMELWEAAPTAANTEYYARIVRDKAVVRNLIHVNTELLRDAYDGAMSADELLGTAERKVLEIAEKGTTGEVGTLAKALKSALDRMDERMGREHRDVSGIPTGFVDLDNITAGLQNNELVIIAARPSVGKCVAGESEILLADGSISRIDDLVRRQSATVRTLGDDWKLSAAAPSAFVDDGVKPVFRVTTRLGRVIETTAAHPFRTIRGWVPLSELTAGERIAVPRRLPVFGREAMPECEVKLLAYLIGGFGEDLTPRPPLHEWRGGVQEADADELPPCHSPTPTRFVGNSCGLNTPSPFMERGTGGEVFRDFLAASRDFHEAAGLQPEGLSPSAQGFALGHGDPNARDPEGVAQTDRERPLQGRKEETTEPPGRSPGLRETALRAEDQQPAGKSPGNAAPPSPSAALTVWLDRLGLWGKSARAKFVPAQVFRLPRRQLALFLNRLFATDGWATVSGEGQTQLGYATTSETLGRQVQHLLLRFGVIASLRARQVKYKGTRRPAWQLDITEPRSIRTFAREIGMFGKEDALTRVLARLDRKQFKACRDTVPAGVWDYLDAARNGEPWARVAARAGLSERSNLHVGTRGLSRARLWKLARAVNSEPLERLAESDVYWDRIASIEPVGEKPVYDLTVPGTHNFVANDVCVHNTAFSLNLVRHVIVEEKLPVFFVSLEQSKIEIAERLLCCQAKVDGQKLRKGQLSSEDIDKLLRANDALTGNARDGKVKLFIDDSPAQGMLRIAANARRLKLRHEIRLIVIDYLQLIEPENRRDPRQEQVAQISRRLKFLARELQLPVIALAQVNRGSEDRQDHKPRLSDLRESGSIEQDADTCMILHRPGKYDGGQEDNILEVIIAKQRNGPTGEITLAYLRQFMRYENRAIDGPL